MLTIEPFFCNAALPPKMYVEWKTTDVEIRTGDNVVFSLKNVESPKDWSPTAVSIAASKYFYNGKKKETSIWQLVYRVAKTISDWGVKDHYFNQENADNFFKELCYLMLHQMACFNSPVLFNVGLHLYGARTEPNGYTWAGRPITCDNVYENPQIAACFIQGVKDTLPAIMELARTQAMLFKYGSGTGSNYSSLRSFRERLSEGGKPSGPLSFMQIYDKVSGVVSSGGKTRRAASMRILNIDHPDILEFINCKSEVETWAKDLMAKGHSTDLIYASLPYQNANHSVRISDKFMVALAQGEDWQTTPVTGKGDMPKYKATELWDAIALRAWECGDPGVQFHDSINTWNTCKASGTIGCANPCGEFVFLDNSACNLASLNLRNFQTAEGTLQTLRFQKACRIMLIAMDILIDRASYPTQEICQNSHDFRPLGLGYTNLGAYLMAAGVPYGSDTGVKICKEITSTMHRAALGTSTELAKELKPFAKYEENKESVKDVIGKHLKQMDQSLPNFTHLLDVGSGILQHGIRNAQVTLLAPTGTISFLMDCDTTGIEPELALVKTKTLVGGGTIKQINKSVEPGLQNLGYKKHEVRAILEHLEKHETLKGAPYLDEDIVFQTALGDNQLTWKAHIRMMAAAQPFLSGAISKTINLPSNATVEDVKTVFKTAYDLGLKSITVYRDGSKGTQPVNVKQDSEGQAEPTKTLRNKLPDTRDSITHKFKIDSIEGYFTVGLYADGTPGELFIMVSKEGSTLSGILDSFGISVSMGLQYGIPLEVFIEKFKHTRFEPMGWTPNPEIRVAKSIIDYIFRWLELRFIKQSEHPDVYGGIVESDAPLCSVCGSMTTRVGGCQLCLNCGTSEGCS